MRVSVQLIDAMTGLQLWAERFDKPIADLFDMQDEIVARLAGQLGTQLIAAEARRSVGKPSPDSMDFYFRGMAGLHRGSKTGELMDETRGVFLHALALDPTNIEAMVGLALVDVFVGGNFAPDDRGDRVAAAETLLKKVLSAAPNHALARVWLGRILIGSKRALEGKAECERARVHRIGEERHRPRRRGEVGGAGGNGARPALHNRPLSRRRRKRQSRVSRPPGAYLRRYAPGRNSRNVILADGEATRRSALTRALSRPRLPRPRSGWDSGTRRSG